VAEADSFTGAMRFIGLVGRADILALYERELEHAL
jgi:hypothetical protein